MCQLFVTVPLAVLSVQGTYSNGLTTSVPGNLGRSLRTVQYCIVVKIAGQEEDETPWRGWPDKWMTYIQRTSRRSLMDGDGG